MILTINCGSSSLKYQLFSTDVTQVLAKGMVSRIGEEESYFAQEANGRSLTQKVSIATHREAFDRCIHALLDPTSGVISEMDQIVAVGHRAVHGADLFVESTRIDDAVIRNLELCVPLAPLHNPANLLGIREAQALLPDVPHVAVFDTAFNQTLSPEAYLYAVPYTLYEQYKIRKYGFHGTSVRYVSQRAADVLDQPLSDLKSVVCHLGNGVSLTAVAGGTAVDTTIGFATFSGIMMGTRSGDIDPGLIFHLQRESEMSLDEIERMLYKESGLLGLSGVSNDMRAIIKQAQHGDERCQLAVDKFVFMIKKQIGAFAVAMGGLDCVVFTAGIGENSPLVRKMVCDNMTFLGIALDESVNERAVGSSAETIISHFDSATAVLVIPTNEEKMIALDTQAIANL